MEKVEFYKLYYFEDKGKRQKYYFATKLEAQIARFCAYKTYDAKRLTVRHYIVPVTEVVPVLVQEHQLKNIKISKVDLSKFQDKEPMKEQ